MSIYRQADTYEACCGKRRRSTFRNTQRRSTVLGQGISTSINFRRWDDDSLSPSIRQCQPAVQPAGDAGAVDEQALFYWGARAIRAPHAGRTRALRIAWGVRRRHQYLACGASPVGRSSICSNSSVANSDSSCWCSVASRMPGRFAFGDMPMDLVDAGG